MKPFDHDEIIINNALQNNCPSAPELTHSVLAKLSKPQRKYIVRPTRFAFLIMAIVLIPTITAAAYSSYSKLLKNVNTELTEYLEPVEASCESNGIRIELIAYASDENNLIAYVNLEDTEGLDRVGTESFVIDSINAADTTLTKGGSSGSISLEYYDEETEIATYKILLSGDLSDISEYSISMNKLYYDSNYYSNVDAGIDLSQYADATPESQDVLIYDARKDASFKADYDEPYSVIARDAMDISISDISSFKITNMGFYDGKFHVQICYDASDIFSDHNLYLRNSDTYYLQPSLELYYFSDDYSKDYIDYSFDITPEELGDGSLIIDGKESSYVDGQWGLDIPTNQGNMNIKSADCDLVVEGSTINQIIVSPFGVTAYGTGTYNISNTRAANSNLASLNCGNDTVKLYHAGWSTDDDGFRMSWTYDESGDTGYDNIDVSTVDSITIDGNIIELE